MLRIALDLNVLNCTVGCFFNSLCRLQVFEMAATRKIMSNVKPPYLFRAASDDDDNSNSSRGRNSADEIDPLFGKSLDYQQNLAAIEKARNMISNHINYNYYIPSEFSSWSVSLLFVLQHAMRKMKELSERNFLIYVMDTRSLSSSRIHYAPSLLRYYGLEEMNYRKTQKTLPEYAQGEYLIHGRLTNKRGLWVAVKFEDIAPCLKTVFPKLCQMSGIILLRKMYFRPKGAALGIHDEVMNKILKMAKRFGKALEGVVAVALITSLRRGLSGPKVQQLRQRLKSIQLPKLFTPTDIVSRLGAKLIHLSWKDVPEAGHFMELLRLLDHGPFQGPGRKLDAEYSKTLKRKGSADCVQGVGPTEFQSAVAHKKRRTTEQTRNRRLILKAALNSKLVVIDDD